MTLNHSTGKIRRSGAIKIMCGSLMLLAAALTGTPGAQAADPAPQASPLTLAASQKAAQAALAKCEADGHQVTVTVVDAGGTVKTVLRSDGAGPHTPDSSRKKAYTAASMKRPTMELSEVVVKVARLHSLGLMNDQILLLGGGLPIQAGDTVIGGIGVGGAPGDKMDEACAQAGLDAIK